MEIETGKNLQKLQCLVPLEGPREKDSKRRKVGGEVALTLVEGVWILTLYFILAQYNP